MSELKELHATIAELKRDNQELGGLALATGVILTQLLQKIVSREMNPQNSATTIVNNARNAIEGYASSMNADPVLKERALAAIKQYEDQIRSVLPV